MRKTNRKKHRKWNCYGFKYKKENLARAKNDEKNMQGKRFKISSIVIKLNLRKKGLRSERF